MIIENWYSDKRRTCIIYRVYDHGYIINGFDLVTLSDDYNFLHENSNIYGLRFFEDKIITEYSVPKYIYVFEKGTTKEEMDKMSKELFLLLKLMG